MTAHSGHMKTKTEQQNSTRNQLQKTLALILTQ